MEKISSAWPKLLPGAVIILVSLFILVAVFHIGLIVGSHKALFTHEWNQNYHRNFGNPYREEKNIRVSPFGMMDMIGAHGSAGSLIKIDGLTLVIKGNDETEKTIVTDQNTTFRKKHDTLQLQDLHVGDHLVIIGSPSSTGQIEAKFVRVF